jgi:hypothetical protein
MTSQIFGIVNIFRYPRMRIFSLDCLKSKFFVYTVWQLSSQTEAIKTTQNDENYLLIPSLNIVPARFRTTFTSPLQRIQCPRKRLSRIAFSSLVTVCWIDETASNLVYFIAIFNLGNKRNQPALSVGSGVDGITRGSLVSPKTRSQRPKNAPVQCRAEDTRTNFLETQA